ncbi:interferon-induced guanylate-binding protein 2-like [Dorcoceras hygrometricum]|uniref:Interferon-induced guanylate-binding protein 2-like n=1 Tax=Dorcoceras hygrometricum TaxID=472368 RepID=A0A2Z7BFS6_9LAMI|nr:interferon-induced guanylate-binding protein 2-like [Dorcoceras hygrometricum]
METSRGESAVRNQARAMLNQLEHVGYQQMKRSAKDDATSCWRFSRWISDDDVIGDVIIFSRCFERAVARISSSRSYSESSRNAKISSRSVLSNQTQEDKYFFDEEDSGEAIGEPDASNSSIQSIKQEVAKRNSRSDIPAAKQLTIYESCMTTAELNSNGESDKKPAKEKDTIEALNSFGSYPTGRISTEAIYIRAVLLKKVNERDEVGHCEAIAEIMSIAQCTNRGKNEEIDEAIDRH